MRDLRDLLGVAECAWVAGRAVPELIQAGRWLPPHTVLNGEIVIADGLGPADFGALQERLTLALGSSRDPCGSLPSPLGVTTLLFNGMNGGTLDAAEAGGAYSQFQPAEGE